MTSPVVLRRIDRERSMACFCRLQGQPTLFAGVSVVREWGRVGQAATCRQDPYDTGKAAQAAMDVLGQAKLRRGY